MKKIKGIVLAVLLLGCIIPFASGEGVPEWADVSLNQRGFTEKEEYVLEDPENGRWMYADPTLRIQIVRTWETPEKIRERDYPQAFWCYTAEIWCDIEQGELPVTMWADPGKPGNTGARKSVAQIAAEQHAVLAVSTDLFTARIAQKTVGIVIRNGKILTDGKVGHHPGSRPPFDTLAIYQDGHIDSFVPKAKRAEEYLAEGALQVYTFGPVLVRDGEIPDEIREYDDRNLNPMHAFGMVEPGHYIDVVCEGRLKSVNGSTGVMTEALAKIMKDRSCSIAVALDGGDSAVMAFMGTQLNRVAKSPAGRATCEVLAFGSEKTKRE